MITYHDPTERRMDGEEESRALPCLSLCCFMLFSGLDLSNCSRWFVAAGERQKARFVNMTVNQRINQMKEKGWKGMQSLGQEVGT